jgi:hypothetical protein
MRFAGMRMENFLNPNKPDMGGIAQAGMTHRSAINNAATSTASQVNQAGVSAAAKVEAASILGAATQSQADASTFASGMGMIGQIAGAGIGAIPTGGSFGGGGTGKLLEDPTAKFRELNPGTPVFDWTT